MNFNLVRFNKYFESHYYSHLGLIQYESLKQNHVSGKFGLGNIFIIKISDLAYAIRIILTAHQEIYNAITSI